jgi:hypothetical protein
MVIVSPYAKRQFTDSNVASFASMLAFAEHVYGLAPLAPADANAYDYSDSFGFKRPDLSTVTLGRRPVSLRVREWIRRHPADLRDPT